MVWLGWLTFFLDAVSIKAQTNSLGYSTGLRSYEPALAPEKTIQSNLFERDIEIRAKQSR
jgi:hypothetical protein